MSGDEAFEQKEQNEFMRFKIEASKFADKGLLGRYTNLKAKERKEEEMMNKMFESSANASSVTKL